MAPAETEAETGAATESETWAETEAEATPGAEAETGAAAEAAAATAHLDPAALPAPGSPGLDLLAEEHDRHHREEVRLFVS